MTRHFDAGRRAIRTNGKRDLFGRLPGFLRTAMHAHAGAGLLA
jgi:hypothetical protein